jgi:nitrate/nitrite transporter NarK
MMLLVFVAAVFLWVALPNDTRAPNSERKRFGFRRALRVLRIPSVWFQAFIILCAYVGFKSADDFSLYANEVLYFNEVDAARAGTVSLWMRPIAAIGAGFLADRFGTVRMTLLSFGLLLVGSVALASGAIDAQIAWLFFVSIVCSSLGIFALRGLYFAVMQDGNVPLALTGSAVGFVSVIGFTPDVFMGPLMGYLLDQSPGAPGHQHVFWVVAGFALAGLAASLGFRSARATPQ